jgi:hypothetical protein
MAIKKTPTLNGSGKIFDKHIPDRLQDTALNATYATFLNFTDPRIGGKGDGTTDNTAAFNAALALLAPTGGTLFFPPGIYLMNGSTNPVPGAVWLQGTGFDYHTPADSTDKPRRMSVIRAGAAMSRLVQLGSDATTSASGMTGASAKDLVFDGDNLAASTVKTAGRRNHLIDCQVYNGADNACWIAGQNTHIKGGVYAQDNRGDVIYVQGYYDNKIWDAQIRQPGTTGAAVHAVGVGQTDIQRCHMWAGANAVAAAAKALIWLDGGANGIISTLITDNTIEGVLGPEILLDGNTAPAGVRGAVITGNRFYQNDNMPNDNTYPVIATAGTSVSSIVVTGNIITGRAANFRYKSLLDINASLTGSSRVSLTANSGLYVASMLSGSTPPNHIYQRGNQIHNGASNVRSDNYGRFTASGNGSQTAFTIPHFMATAPASARVTPGSAAAAAPYYVTTDSSNITVTFTTAPAAGASNVVLNWNADV